LPTSKRTSRKPPPSPAKKTARRIRPRDQRRPCARINLVGGRVHDANEWKTRHADNNEWVKDQLAKHGDKVRALVVFAQAEPNATHDSFFRPFVTQIKAWGKPTLYLHADGHKWEVHKKWRADNLLRVQTDMIGTNPPVIVTVGDDADEPFQFERRKRKK